MRGTTELTGQGRNGGNARRRHLRSLRSKLVLLCVIGMTIPLIYQLFIASDRLFEDYIAQYSHAVHQSLEYASIGVEDYVDNARSWSVLVSGNLSYINLLSGRSSRTGVVGTHLYGTLQTLFDTHEEILRLLFWSRYNSERACIQQRGLGISFNYFTPESFASRQGFSWEELTRQGFLVQPAHPAEGTSDGRACFDLIWSIPEGAANPLAVLSAEIDFAPIERFLLPKSLESGEAVLWLDADNRVIFSGGDGALTDIDFDRLTPEDGGDYYKLSVGDRPCFAFRSREFCGGFHILRLTPAAVVTGAVSEARRGDVVAFLASLMIALLIILWGIYRLTSPFERLSDAMLKLGKGDFHVALTTDGLDAELVPLMQRFNDMSELIDQLVTEKYRLVIEQQEAELQALQAQINPHFLYNTLQMLNSFALKHNAYEISTAINALGDMLHYCLQDPDVPVTLADEIENTRSYLTIQKLRFLSRLSFGFNVDPALEGFRLPRMTLQPLVENCVVHGMDAQTGTCTITITAARHEGEVWLEVHNTCDSPISPEKLGEIEALLADGSPETAGHIGLKNCALRMKYFYGEGTRFKLMSSADLGTCVRITIEDGGVRDEMPDRR